MPFAPRIRKEILDALEKHIIPALWKQQVSLGYVMPPLQFPQGISKRLLSSRLPRADEEQPEFPIEKRWAKAKLHSTHFPYLSFIYAGIADERTLVTAAQENQFKIAKGIYALRWQAPGVLLFPEGTPRNTGGKLFWEDSTPRASSMKVLQLGFLNHELLVHTSLEEVAQPFSNASHSLQIRDVSLQSLAELFLNEMRHSSFNCQETAQSLLLALMLRLRDHLRSSPIKIANTARPRIAQPQLLDARHQAVWQKIVQFIQMHLHEQLSITSIAGDANVSPAHLNNLCRRFSGTSAMKYVRLQRIAAAKVMLIGQRESINEIATLLHFSSASAFCSVFREETGLTPKQFRYQAIRESKFTS